MRINELKLFSLNFGPQHPSAHGVLRVILKLSGEYIENAEPHIGLLHRGTEKLIEHKTFIQSVPYLDRLDYVSVMAQEHTYSQAVESIVGLPIPERAKFIRVLFLEITRILNHLMAITTHALDVGALSPFLWAFEEREKLMEFYERVSGARMHACYIRPGGVSQDIPTGLLHDIFTFAVEFGYRITEIEVFLTENRIWQQRLMNIGIVDIKNAFSYSFSGVMLRGSGFPYDIRKFCSYEIYDKLNFSVIVGENGDCYDRYLVRINEMRQSLKIIIEVVNNMPSGLWKSSSEKYSAPLRKELRLNMEAVINHFKFYGDGYTIDPDEVYLSTESPKGEFGVFLVTDGSNKPYRCKFRSPSYYHLNGTDFMVRGSLLADLVAVVGTQDIVLGEIDR